MHTNIDQLKTEINEIKKWLDELWNNIALSPEEKENKAEALKAQAETAKQKIQSEIDSLKDKTDDESKKQKEEAETLLNSFNEIMSLYNSILNNWKATVETTTQAGESSTDIQIETEEKWFFWKTKDWVWEQWDDVWSKEKRQQEWWKNLFRTAWFVATWVWAIALTVKWIKKLFWKDKGKEKPSHRSSSGGEKKSRWRRFLVWAWITAWSVVGWVGIYKNWNRITSWVKEKLWKALNFEEAMYTVEAEVRNWINSDNNFWEFSAHFGGMSYDENTHEICSFWQKTKINKSNKTIDWKYMNEIQFASWEELFHAVNIVNFAKRELRWRWANETPFAVNKRTWDIDFSLSDKWKTQFVGASWSNFWTKFFWLWWAWWGWLLWWYFLWLKWWLTWAVAWWLAWYTLWSVIDNTSTMWRACWTIAKWANLQKFVNYLNEQNFWWEQKEVYESDGTTPIHKYLNKVKQEINEAYWDWTEDSAKRDLKVERNESTPDIYKIKSYYQEITLKLDWCTAKKWEEIDFSKINNIHIEKYETIDGQRIDSRWDWLDIDFPHNEEWLKEVIRTANLTNKIVNDWKWEWWEAYPFAYGKYISWNNVAAFNFDIDTRGMWSNRQWWTCILTHDKLKKWYPTILKDLEKYDRWVLAWKQDKMHNQANPTANQYKSKWSQYIKFLHQIGMWKFWKKVW